MDKIPICACIITYNPNLKRLRECIDSIINQVDALVIVDNNSSNKDDIYYKYNDKSNISIIFNESNLGLSKALNQGMQWAIDHSFEWVLTLDQDSVCSKKLIKSYCEYLKYNNIGIITCRIKDRNSKMTTHKFDEQYKFISSCITSGSLSNVKVFKNVKGYDENLFIDMVDTDYCYTLGENGYKIIMVNYIGLLHELGQSRMHRLFGFRFEVTNHSAERKYTITKNSVYLILKHRLNLFTEFFVIIARFFTVLIYEKDKKKKIKMMAKGIIDGIKMKDCLG